VKWEWFFPVSHLLPHRVEERMSILDYSLPTVLGDVSVKRKPDQYPRTIVNMGIYDHMSGHLDNCTGQTSI
jgi:hypothetical protein